MRKLIAVASGDWHLNDWKNYNKDRSRTLMGDMFLLHLLDLSEEKGIPILFTGDLFQTPKSLTNWMISHYIQFFLGVGKQYKGARVVGITGNHDESEGSSYVKSFFSISNGVCQCIDNNRICIGDTMVYGMPYDKSNKYMAANIEKIRHMDHEYKKILLIHTNLYGAQDPNGYEVDEVPNIPRNLGKFFSGIDLVLSGHIHKYGELWDGKVHMVGAPYHQRTSDSGTSMGYLNIYDDMTTEFVKYKAPEFKFCKDGEPLPDDYNWYITIPKAIVQEKEEETNFSNVSNKTEIAKEYCRAKGVKNRRRIKLLVDTLNETEE